MLSGKALNAYVVAGIRSDHECTRAREAKEKLNSGMWIMLREGTAARNVKDLLPLVTPVNARRFFFVTDDRHPRELLMEGHIDSIVRKAIRLGLDPLLAIQMASLNAAEYFGLDDLGAIAPGFRADIVAVDHLSRFNIKKVFKDGILIAEEGRIVSSAWRRLTPESYPKAPSSFQRSVRFKGVSPDDLLLRSDQSRAKIIELIPDQIVTKKVIKEMPLRDGIAHPDVKHDILKAVVVERHRSTGRIGIGFVKGFGLQEGAIGSSVAHDSHNLVIVGTHDRDILKAITALKAMGGGLVATRGNKVLASVPLPIAGLISEKSVREVYGQMETLRKEVKALGCQLPDPFMTLSFLSLPVIPALKLTDKGLIDVTRFKIVSLFGEE
jgi:adenine deaminase